MTINCIIIDDEPLARKGLREYISEVDYLHLLGDFDSPLQSTELIARGQVQLIFLDIQMPRITGLEFMKTMQNMPLVIFTTAYPNYAVEGFELNAMDYLVKPVSFDRFLKAVHKIKEYYEVRERNVTETTTSSGYFFIKADNKLVKIFYDDVLLVEGLQNYVSIHTRQGSTLLILRSSR
jgi:DNA-binding LytR/AlgR family response regulator